MSTITTLNDWITGASFRWQVNTNFANLNTDKAELSGATFTGDIIVPAEAYGAGWNGSNEVPTKNDLYDKIETMWGGWATTFLWLTDTPSSYSWQTGKFPKVNAGETALEFVTIPGGGDMLTSTYDPTNVSWDAFDMENMVEGATNKILTTAERTKLTNTSGTNSGDQTSIVGITGTKAQFDTACTDGNFLYSWDIISASTTAQGIVELATTAEINTGTDSTRAMPVDQFVASNRNVRYVQIDPIAWTADNAVGTKTGDITYRSLFTGTIVWIGAYVETAWVTWSSVWDVNINGTTIMTTNKLTIETTETSTTDATTQPTLTTTAISVWDLVTIDTNSLSTTKPKGLHVYLLIRLT